MGALSGERRRRPIADIGIARPGSLETRSTQDEYHAQRESFILPDIEQKQEESGRSSPKLPNCFKKNTLMRYVQHKPKDLGILACGKNPKRKALNVAWGELLKAQDD
jgi:hypothetical protein